VGGISAIIGGKGGALVMSRHANLLDTTGRVVKPTAGYLVSYSL
jgi:hypothetical protein